MTTRNRKPVFRHFAAACAALQLGERDSLVTVVSRLKSASARHANGELHRIGAVWSRAFHDHAMRDEDSVRDTARYIIANPLRAGLVKRVGDYPFWNTVWL